MAHYDIGDALSLIENILLASMRRNLNRHLHEEADEGFQWSMWQAEQLTSLGNWSARNLKTHSKDFTLINNAAMQLLQNANNQAELDEELKLLRSGIQQAAEFFDVPDEKFQALLNAVRSDLSRAEHSILRQADDMYRKAIFDANVYLQTGSGTLKDAIGMAVQDMHTRGIQAVMYRNGRRVTASAYARMALRTANERAQLMGEGRARDKFGVHTIIVPPSGIACPQCAPFLGKIMVDDVYCAGTPEEAKGLGVPLLSEAIGQGFLHPQCNCSPQTYFPGSPVPEMMEQNREEAVRKYKLTQRQRYNERQIRKWKAAEQSAPNDLEKQAACGKIRAWQKQNRELCDKYPDTLRRDYEREKLYDLTSKAIVPDVIEKPANVLDKSAESGIIEVGSDGVALENQRYGRNKATLVNKTYIESGEYRRKYDNCTDNTEVNKILYDCAKKALKHRSGTVLEDMYWIDGSTGDVILAETECTVPRGIPYTDRIKNAIKDAENIVTLHTHPSSMPPSIEDFNSCCRNHYMIGFIACHNGKVIWYRSEQEISKSLYNLYIGEYLTKGFEEFDAQWKALEKLKENYLIDFGEVEYHG